MTKIYHDGDLWDAFMQKRRILSLFLAVTGAVFLGLVGFVTYYIMLPYNDPNATWVIAVSCVLVGVYLIFAFPYMGICYKRCNSYCKALKFISVGLKEYSVLPFVGIEDWTTHDGVDVNVAIFSVKNIKRDEEMLRQIYVDGEKDFPAFKEGQYARLVSQGNLLIEYELTDEPSIKETNK